MHGMSHTQRWRSSPRPAADAELKSAISCAAEEGTSLRVPLARLRAQLGTEEVPWQDVIF
jgi:hypothetical protein